MPFGLFSTPEEQKTEPWQQWQIQSSLPFLIYLPSLPNGSGIVNAPPTISNFTTHTEEIISETNTFLFWEVQGLYSDITVVPAVGFLTDQNGAMVAPTDTTTYRLTVANQFGSDTAELTISVVEALEPPSMTSFSASPERVGDGKATTLTWEIDGLASTVSISPDVGDVTGLVSTVIYPAADQIYTITASNVQGGDSAQVSIEIIPLPIINSFNSNRAVLDEGEQANLSWSISGEVDAITLNPGNVDVTNQTSIVVSPTLTTHYELVALNASRVCI